MIGSLIILAPWIPIFEDAFAFVLAVSGFLYPEIRKTFFDHRHSRLLNRLIVDAEKYQRNEKIQYMSEARLQEELEAVGRTAGPRKREKTAEGSRGPQGKERA